MSLTNLKTYARSIVLSYVRAFAVVFIAGLSGVLNGDKPDPTAAAALVTAAGWAAIPAGLRAIEAVVGTIKPKSLVWRVTLSFARMGVAAGIMTLTGAVDGAGAQWHAFLLAVSAGAVRLAQQWLDQTAPAVEPAA